ncbi:helix-turn-helix domain-containing protein [Catenuloplanes sp. NPDC051500]|uniref:helix-turn-helix domain-containing protein n=1 Tax=Catenuloplanes sp. NPDC051500 TaxID=3363959 RepID=UPI0037AA82CF
MTLANREEISHGLAEGLGYKEVARLIGRNASAVCRDVAWHGGRARYRAVTADETATGRARAQLYPVTVAEHGRDGVVEDWRHRRRSRAGCRVATVTISLYGCHMGRFTNGSTPSWSPP